MSLRPPFYHLTLPLLLLLAGGVFAQTDSIGVDSVEAMVNDPEYQRLLEELYGEEETATVEASSVTEKEEQIRKRRSRSRTERGLLQEGYLHGMNFVITGASPYAVASNMHSWYSYIDMGFTLRLPYRTEVEAIPLYFDAEIATFSFENTFPEGGLYEGMAYLMRASAEWTHWGTSAGLGFWEGALGGLLEANYTFWPTNVLFARLGTRGVLVTDVEPLGTAWWLDLRFSVGFEL